MSLGSSFSPPIRSDVLCRLADHWDQIRRPRRMPARRDFDPLNVRYAIGFISLIEVHLAPLRFFFRLDGTKQVDLFGCDCTRRYLDEALPPEHVAMATESYREVVESRAPRHHRRKIRLHERIIDYEILILPFSEDGDRVSLLMTGIVPEYA